MIVNIMSCTDIYRYFIFTMMVMVVDSPTSIVGAGDIIAKLVHEFLSSVYSCEKVKVSADGTGGTDNKWKITAMFWLDEEESAAKRAMEVSVHLINSAISSSEPVPKPEPVPEPEPESPIDASIQTIMQCIRDLKGDGCVGVSLVGRVSNLPI